MHLSTTVACALVALAALAPRAHAQWTRVSGVPPVFVYSLHVQGDTIVAGGDSLAWLSTDAGATWTPTATVGEPPAFLDAVWFRDGRLWAGTGGQGVFTSDDLGASWQPRSDGLEGGLFGSHDFVNHFAARGDTLYAATEGAGVFARPLAGGPWRVTGPELVANQAGGVAQLGVRGARMLAAGGFNGQVFRNDGGAPWTPMFLDNTGLLPGLGVTCAGWTGTAWLVGTDHGFYRSPDGDNPWTFVGLNLSGTFESRVAAADGRAFVCVNRSVGGTFAWTSDDGAAWSPLGTEPAHAQDLAVVGPRLWAARSDGLWWRDVSRLDAPRAPVAAGLRLLGAHPAAGDQATLAFRLAAPARATVEVFDVGGRRARSETREAGAGEHRAVLDLRGLPAGAYLARLAAAGRVETLRFVRVTP